MIKDKFDFSKLKLNKVQRKQVLVLGGLFCLLLITGYMNFKLNNNMSSIVKSKGKDQVVSSQLPEHNSAVSASTGNFFADFRQDRQRIRDKEIASIDSVINGKNTDAQVLAKAQEQKIKVSSAMEKEITLEGLLKSKGFSDAVVTIRENSINVVVEEAEIDEKKVAQILEVVQRETGEESSNIKVLPKG